MNLLVWSVILAASSRAFSVSLVISAAFAFFSLSAFSLASFSQMMPFK